MSTVDQEIRKGFDSGLIFDEPDTSNEQDASEHLYTTEDKHNELSHIPVSNQISELESVTQSEQVEQFKSWLSDKEQSAQRAPRHAYSRAHAGYHAARIYDVDRRVQWAYTDPHTIMITGGGGCFEDSKSTPILDFHDKIHSVHSTVMRQVRRALGDRDYTYIKLYTPSKERNYGQTHWHLGIWCEGSIEESDLKPVVDSYVRNCSVAKTEYHTMDNAVRVEPLDYDMLHEYSGDRGKGPTSKMAGYLVKNLVSMNHEGVDVRSSDFAELLWSAQMNAGSRNKWYPSSNFSDLAEEIRYMRENS